MNAAHHHQLISHTRRQSRKLSPPAAQRPYGQYEEPSPPYTTASSNYTTNDPLEPSPAKRPRLSGPGNSEVSNETAARAMAKTGAAGANKPSTSSSADSSASRPQPRRGSAEGAGDGKAPIPAGAAGAKSRRVRTGCLTCRERHLKCDEGLPDCVNCRKSNRECKRGIRLNFIDTQCKDPPFIPPTLEWSGMSERARETTCVNGELFNEKRVILTAGTTYSPVSGRIEADSLRVSRRTWEIRQV